jgi:hypothetical protein
MPVAQVRIFLSILMRRGPTAAAGYWFGAGLRSVGDHRLRAKAHACTREPGQRNDPWLFAVEPAPIRSRRQSSHRLGPLKVPASGSALRAGNARSGDALNDTDGFSQLAFQRWGANRTLKLADLELDDV